MIPLLDGKRKRGDTPGRVVCGLSQPLGASRMMAIPVANVI